MSVELCFAAVIILAFIAVLDLMVGVSNDAVNFLNSSLGSRVAPRHIIMIIASLGIIAGVLFSSGMMEVARKGIFHPQFFTMPELLAIFLAVMIADIIILDLFNTYGLPTSTTVSIVFELLGAAVALSVIKIIGADADWETLGSYINTAKAMTIIMGILLSVVVAFVCGALAQFASRLIFTFDYKPRLKRYGAVWGGFAMATIVLFILIKGAKGASFLSADDAKWIRAHSFEILGVCFVLSTALLHTLYVYFHVNILKPVVLVGTFALAMAFAANDLVNFIGVPLAGLHSYNAAIASGDPTGAMMEALAGKVRSETLWLLLAGMIMVVTLWLSRKARTVTETEISLGRQEEGVETFETLALSRMIVRGCSSFFAALKSAVPSQLRAVISKRVDPSVYNAESENADTPSFDLLRASVNLMVASAVVSWATSMKLPLSTTYVTFMVAMGTSFSDQAWDRESAVYRVTGVLTVIGGWFFTAFMAFSTAFLFALIIYHFTGFGIAVLLFLAGYLIYRTHFMHKERAKESEQQLIFNLKKIDDPKTSIETIYKHTSILLGTVRSSLDQVIEAFFAEDLLSLRKQKRVVKRIQLWTNVITANTFKVLRLLDRMSIETHEQYPEVIRCLQSIADVHRDVTMRTYSHISNNHKGLLPEQIEELRSVKVKIEDILLTVETTLESTTVPELDALLEMDQELHSMTERISEKQIERIRDRSSKTRLSILFYAIIGDIRRLSRRNIRLAEVFRDSLRSRNTQ